ncbi:MAG: hypothetical protein KAZ88_03630 [Acidimicrobiia bacterium]|jgi:hypothetical protein|nr:hypothetical protein [Acidimicrobiia bacterium]MBP8180067.1 hypothetical protein [Acidimicrobiia bacterium]
MSYPLDIPAVAAAYMATRARAKQAEINHLGELHAGLPEHDPVWVDAFDQGVDLIESDDPGVLREFILECCRDRSDEDLAYFGAGIPESIVNRGRVESLSALVEAARSDRFVRRSLAFAWFSPTTKDPAALKLIAEIESLAIHGQTEA